MGYLAVCVSHLAVLLLFLLQDVIAHTQIGDQMQNYGAVQKQSLEDAIGDYDDNQPKPEYGTRRKKYVDIINRFRHPCEIKDISWNTLQLKNIQNYMLDKNCWNIRLERIYTKIILNTFKSPLYQLQRDRDLVERCKLLRKYELCQHVLPPTTTSQSTTTTSTTTSTKKPTTTTPAPFRYDINDREIEEIIFY